jgi:hypothetical protein
MQDEDLMEFHQARRKNYQKSDKIELTSIGNCTIRHDDLLST